MTKHLKLTSAMAAALIALPGCSSNDDWDDTVVADQDVAICVDPSGERVEDYRCNEYRQSGGSSGLLWYYIGRGSRVPYYGDRIHDRRFARGGSFTRQPGASYYPAPVESQVTRSHAVSRGGLGSSGRRFGSGRS